MTWPFPHQAVHFNGVLHFVLALCPGIVSSFFSVPPSLVSRLPLATCPCNRGLQAKFHQERFLPDAGQLGRRANQIVVDVDSRSREITVP